MSIELRQINKFFGASQVLHDISLDIASGQMVALLGPSGSGKTTLLRIIAGLESQERGEIYFQQKEVSRLHARERQVGFVFQNYALFRHMTVFDNVAFGLKIRPRHERLNPAALRARVMQLLEMVQLDQLVNRYPGQLSGGQKQRVALARALAVEPQILLLDEPFGALDAQVRTELRRWLRQLHEQLKFTSVFVTHDQQEAMEVADRIVVMHQGRIEQSGTPQGIWDAPANRFILQFLGEINQINGEIDGSRLQVGNHYWPLALTPLYQGRVELYLRPWEIDLTSQATDACPLPVTVLESTYRGHYWQLTLQPQGWSNEPINAIHPDQGTDRPQCGDRYFVGINQARLFLDQQIGTVEQGAEEHAERLRDLLGINLLPRNKSAFIQQRNVI